MRKIKFPSAQTILFIIAGIVAIMTYLIPAGSYDRLNYQTESKSFTRTHLGELTVLPGEQKTLDDLGIKIPLEKFTSGAIYKPISIPGSYTTLPSKPQGIFAFLKSPIKGLIAASDVIFFVLILGGFIGIMNRTGAFDAGISWLARTMKGREYWLIIFVMSLVALGGTTFGLAEETMAFYPILIPVFLAARYDGMVGLASIYLGTTIGTMFSTINPFSVIIASDAAGINWTTGLNGRFFMLLVGLIICIIYTIRYANKVQNDPSKSIIYNQREEHEAMFGMRSDNMQLTNRLRLILLVFVISFVVMIVGVSRLNWWFVEMTTTFVIGSIVIGVIARIKESDFLESFARGAADLLNVSLIIGIARGVSILMDDGLISDTILYYTSSLTTGMNKGLFVNVMLFIYSGLSFFIPSSSGMAVLSMPIMAPLADTVGIGREHIINTYQYGMGLFSFINPTGLVLASLAVVKIGFDKWLKFVLPLFGIIILITMAYLTFSVYL